MRTRQACLNCGSVRIASGCWVGDGIRPAFRFRPSTKEFVDHPSAGLNTHLTGYKGGAATPRKEEAGFSNTTPLGG